MGFGQSEHKTYCCLHGLGCIESNIVGSPAFIKNKPYIEDAMNGYDSIKGLRDQILEKQSADGLDSVSGATCSSEMIKSAVADALEQAKISETPDVSTDKTDLQAAVDAVKAAGYEESKYTAESWAALQAALASANDVLANENATQDDVDAAKNTLDHAVAALEAPAAPPVDKTKLETAICSATVQTARLPAVPVR